MHKVRLIILFSIICSEHSFGQNIIKGAPRNIIIITANGMGMNHIAAASLKSGDMLSWAEFPVTGFSQPWPLNGKQPSDSLIAMAIGTNKFQHTDKGTKPKTIFDLAKEEKMKTGLITTEPVTGMIPKTFVFDNTSKKDNEALALDYLSSNLDIIIGGGSKYFDNRYDGRNLFKEFKKKGYNIKSSLSALNSPSPAKTIALLEKDGIYRASERKDYLTKAALFAMRSMAGESGGYFLIIDDSKIEEADSLNNTPLLMEEMLDIDKLVSTLVQQANGETLIVVTGNYESGGLEVKNGNMKPKSDPDITWHSKKPTAELAPVFAKGPGAEQFSGFYSQADIYKKLAGLIAERP